MRTTLTGIAALAVASVTLTAAAAAGSPPAKQRVAIRFTGGNSFVLTPLTSGRIKADTGIAIFCCWTRRPIIRCGESFEINNPRMTLTGKQGTLVTRNLIGWIDLPDGYSLFTGTWRVIHATGAYAGLTGGGSGAGVGLPNGNSKVTFEGFLSPK
jgi:hypothetical protein